MKHTEPLLRNKQAADSDNSPLILVGYDPSVQITIQISVQSSTWRVLKRRDRLVSFRQRVEHTNILLLYYRQHSDVSTSTAQNTWINKYVVTCTKPVLLSVEVTSRNFLEKGGNTKYFTGDWTKLSFSAADHELISTNQIRSRIEPPDNWFRVAWPWNLNPGRFSLSIVFSVEEAICRKTFELPTPGVMSEGKWRPCEWCKLTERINTNNNDI